MNRRALVVGEALIDEVIDGDRVTRHPGGSPANVALGLARLGVPTRLHTDIGADPDGELIRDRLAAAGATVTPESVTSARTSTAAAVLAADGSARYRFALGWDPAPLDDLEAPALIHTGSLGAFLSPGDRVTQDILRRGHSGGALISVDPNIRASLLAAPATTRAAFEQLASGAHLVKLSDEDAEYLYPGLAPTAVLELLIRSGVAVAAMTRGADGALLASGDRRASVPAVRTTVADTVGAGDSFMAALIRALAFDDAGWDGRPIATERLEEIGHEAARAAAITVSRAGADLPTLDDLRAG